MKVLDRESLAKLIIEKRKKEKKTLRELSKELGISHTSIHRAEKQKNVDVDAVINLTIWLDVVFWELIITIENNENKR